jgi:hypothetical protein
VNLYHCDVSRTNGGAARLFHVENTAADLRRRLRLGVKQREEAGMPQFTDARCSTERILSSEPAPIGRQESLPGLQKKKTFHKI